jgi:peptide/nickel transport system permease protein
MGAYIIRRILQMIPILLGVALLVFVLFTVVGEDPVRVALGSHATQAAIDDLRHRWGLDQSLPQQFLSFLKQVVTFDYGNSFQTGEKLNRMFLDGATVSLSLTVPPFILGTCLSIAISMLIAYYRGSLFDRVATAITIMGMSISYLVYIIAMQYVLAYKADLFPINGYESGFSGVRYLLLPWMIFMVVSLGPDTRMYRTIFLDETGADYVRTARAKGCSETRTLFHHVLKNAMIPILTHTIVVIPFLVLGAFLMERYFSLPGIGDLMITAINNGDRPVLMGLTMFIAIGFTAFNLLTDLLYAAVDPRVKLS